MVRLYSGASTRISVGRFLQQAAAGAGGGPSDDDFANVVLLLDGDGTSGAQNETFTDSSTNGFTVTETGSVVQGSFSPYGDNWSNYFGGESGLNFGDVTAVDFDANDWTMELWWNPQDLSAGDPFVFKDNVDTRSFQFRHSNNSTNEITFLFWSSNTLYNSETNNEFVYSSGFNVGEWYHIALVHDSGTFECFVNGTSIGTWTPAANNIDSGTDTLNVGYYSGGTPAYASGYLSNVRVVNGTALYTSSFTPSTSPLTAVTNTTLLTCQSNSFKDNSSNDYSVTLAGSPKVTPFSPFKNDNARDITTDGGSAYFDGSSYLSTPNDTAYRPNTGAYTVEGWFYITKNTTQMLFDARQTGNTDQRVGFWVTNGDDLNYWHGVGTSTSSNVFNMGEWVYIAASRGSGTTEIYVNGTRTKSFSDSTQLYNFRPYYGARWDAGAKLDEGYLADWRITVGEKLYTGTTMTVPTAPIGLHSSTDSYLAFQDAGIYDRSGINNLDTVGNAQIDTAVVKYGTGSMQFDGSGDGLSSPETTSFGFGSGDFTIEAWAYLTTNGVFNNIVSAGVDASNGYRLDISTSNNLRFLAYIGSWATIITGSTSLATGQWYHLAVTRNGNNFDLWVDGSSDATTVSNSGTITEPTTKIEVGAVTTNSLNRSFNGYLDDVRVTKGIARYTANFTAPTAELPKF